MVIHLNLIGDTILAMANFNRGGRSGGGRGFERKGGSLGGSRGRFGGGRDSRGPVQMHQAVCDNCKKECEVPFRPTNGKPVFCSSCFESNRGSDSGRYESRNSGRSTNFEEKRMFKAVCNECGNSCEVPFQPRGDKPVYCGNCFGGKKGAGNGGGGQCQSQCKDQFELLNNKLDRILEILAPNAASKGEEVVVEEVKPEKTKKSAPKKKAAKA